MSKEQCIEVEGVITAKYQAHIYKVKLQNGHEITGQLNGKMANRKIWCQIGDRILCEISVYDLSKGRIFRRL